MAKKRTHEDEDDFDVDVDSETWDDSDDDEVIDDDSGATSRFMSVSRRQRDWRDLERYREERELRKLMNDDYLFDDEKPNWSQR